MTQNRNCYKCGQLLCRIEWFDNSQALISDYCCSNCLNEKRVKKCQYMLHGCKFEHNNNFLIEKHNTNICKYRPCISCNAHNYQSTALFHFASNHCELLNTRKEDHFTITEWRVNTECKQDYYILAFDHIFYIHFRNLEDVMCIFIDTEGDDHGANYFVWEYAISYSDVHEEAKGLVLPMDSKTVETYNWISDWYTVLFKPCSVMRNVSINNQCKIRLFLYKKTY